MSSFSAYGVTKAGFVAKKQSEIIAEMQARLRGAFGSNVNLDDRSPEGQIIGISSEREALLWEILEAVYLNAYPAGAEGLSVDNILALNNLRRLTASYSKTDPTPVTDATGVTRYGLILYGTPGTIVPKDSLVGTTATPPVQFKLDADVTIQTSNDAAQTVLAGTPDAGAAILSLTSPQTGASLLVAVNVGGSGGSVDTSYIALSAALTLSTQEFYVMMEDEVYGPISTAHTPASVMSGSGFAFDWTFGGNVGVAQLVSFQASSDAAYMPIIEPNGYKITFSISSNTGTYTLAVNDGVSTRTTAALAANASAAQVQAAIRALNTRYSRVFVTADSSSATRKFYVNWNGSPVTSASVPSNSTGATMAFVTTNATGVTLTRLDSLMAEINNVLDTDGTRPFADVGVVGNPSLAQFTLFFGETDGRPSEPTSAGRPIAIITAPANSLMDSSQAVDIIVSQVSEGAQARGIGTATAVATGAAAPSSGQLTVIGTPRSGWTGVTNGLDVIAGRDVEEDPDAMARRASLLSALAQGPKGAIISSVRGVAGVTSAVGVMNQTDAAVQILTFASVPTTGTFTLTIGDSDPTTALTPSAVAQDIQTALAALPGYERVLVSGSMLYGFQIEMNGSAGGQPQSLIQVPSNTTGVAIAAVYGRPPNSFEVVVLGGRVPDIAQAIYQRMPAGITAYGAPVASVTADMTTNSSTIVVSDATGLAVGQAVFGAGIPPGTTVLSVASTVVMLSAAAEQTASGVPLIFDNTTYISDDFGTPTAVNFTRPVATAIYVKIVLITDTYRIPGVSASGLNPGAKFRPSSIVAIRDDILAVGDTLQPGATIIGKGTLGLVGSFREVPGIVDYDLTFGFATNPTNEDPIQLLLTQAPLFQSNAISVTFT